MLKKSASVVLASLRGSTYGTEYAAPLRLLRPCWTAFLNILRSILQAGRVLHCGVFIPVPNSFSAVWYIRLCQVRIIDDVIERGC